MTASRTARAIILPPGPTAEAQEHVVARIVVENGVPTLHLWEGRGWVSTPVANIETFEVRTTHPRVVSGNLLVTDIRGLKR